MRSIETLVREYPNKTGTQILDIQEADKLKDELEYQEYNKIQLAFVNKINTDSGYYRGKFGVNQHYYYRVYNALLDTNGTIYVDVEKIVLFVGSPNGVVKDNEMRFERRVDTYSDASKYSFGNEEEVTVKEWDKVNTYLDNIATLFW